MTNRYAQGNECPECANGAFIPGNECPECGKRKWREGRSRRIRETVAMFAHDGVHVTRADALRFAARVERNRTARRFG